MKFSDKETSKIAPVDIRTKLYPVVSENWNSSKHKVLFLLERPDPLDIESSRLMSPNSGSGRDLAVNLVTNSINGIISWVMKENPQAEYNHAFGVAVFSSATTEEVIRVLKPTKVVLAGYKCSSHLLPEYPNFYLMPGNIIEKEGVSYLQTLPIDQLLYKKNSDNVSAEESSADMADLLYMVSRNVSNLIKGHNPYSLSNLTPKAIVVDTLDKFEKLLSKLNSIEVFSCDIETANLSSYHNSLLTIQFALSSKAGYWIPIDHKDSPFTETEVNYIKRSLRSLFGKTDNGVKTIIGFNFKFDLRVLRATLKLPHVPHNIWEITAGEHCLDENIGLLSGGSSFQGPGSLPIKTSFANLKNLFCLYGNDYYLTAEFGKAQRNTLVSVNIMEDVGAQNYMVMDVISIFGIYEQQLLRSSATKVFDKSWKIFRPIFENHVINQMGVTVKTLSLKEEYGTFVDPEYMRDLQDPKVSKLVPLLRELKSQLLSLPSIKKAEKLISARNGVTSNTLFDVSTSTSVFKIKPAHLAILFFDVLKLKPLRRTESGAPSADREFLEENADMYEEATILLEYSEAMKLLNTYVGSWDREIKENMDGSTDGCLRPSFDFFAVITGRLSSRGPNLQNVPVRGKLAKLIKRLFISPRGHLSPRWDFSAHEVRMWGNAARDTAVSASFNAGLALRRDLIKGPTDEKRAELKKKGDFHLLNVKRFFGKWVEKTDPLRDAVKSVVFGIIYGKTAKTLGRDLQKQKIKEIKSFIRAAKLELELELRKANE